MQYQVRTFHAASGAVAESMMEGESMDAIMQRLGQEGVTVLSIVAHQPRAHWRSKRTPFRVGLFCDELRTLLSSGMSLVEAIDTLGAKRGHDETLIVLSDLQQRLREGKAFSTALELNSYPFPPLLIASIRASERTSRVDQALEEYSSYDKVGQELRKKLISAAIYPSLVIGFGFLVSLFMISYVVPRFAKVYDDFAPTLSISTLALMRIGQFAGDHLALLLASLAVLIVAGVWGYRSGKLQALALRLLGQFKVAQHYLRIYQLARIYQTLSMLLKGGYTLADAIPLAQSLAFDKSLQNQIVEARQTIVEGRRLSAAFASHGLTDHVAERLLQVGERSGNLAHVLDIISQTYRQEFTLFIERATRLAEPLLLMIVGLMIGAIIVLMYMPVFDLAGGI